MTLCRARTFCTVLAGQMGMPPQRASGRSTSSSEHSGRDVSGSHSEEPGLNRQRTCFVNTASGGSSFDSWRKPAQTTAQLGTIGQEQFMEAVEDLFVEEVLMDMLHASSGSLKINLIPRKQLLHPQTCCRAMTDHADVSSFPCTPALHENL